MEKIITQSGPQKTSFRAWIVWAMGGLFVLYQYLLQTSTGVMEPDLLKVFRINTLDYGFLSSTFFYTYVALQIPAGIAVDEWGARRVLGAGIVICALAAGWFGMTHSFHAAEASRMVMGFATAPAVAGTMYLAANWFAPSRFAMLAGLTEMLGMLGGAVGQQFLAQCIADFGWRNTMYVSAGVGLVLAIFFWFIVRDRKSSTPTHEALPEKQPVRRILQQIMCLPQVWLYGLLSGLLFAPLAAFASLWAVPFFMAYYHIKLQLAASMSSLMFVGAVLGNPLAGWCSDKMKRRKPIMLIGTLGLLGIFLIMLLLTTIPLTLMFGLAFLLGLFSGAYVISFAAVSDITSIHVRGTAMAFINMMCILFGAPILQPLIGYILQVENHQVLTTAGKSLYTVQDYQHALFVFPIYLAFALVVLAFARETYR